MSLTLNPQPSKLAESSVIPPEASGSRASLSADAPKVVLIDVRGLIIDAPQRGLLSPAINPVDELVARLEKAEFDPRVRAVVLRINSPGGGVAATETMYREVVRFRERSGKPVVASMGDVAASGGYYLALAADAVYAQPTTITGSIGVIMPTINVSQGLARIGIVSRALKSGQNKDMANPLEPMREGQYALLQEMVDEFYTRFRATVEERRRAVLTAHAAHPSASGVRPVMIEPDSARSALESFNASIDDLTDGRIITGDRAARYGLVDATGGVREAFTHAALLAGLSPDRTRLVKYYDSNDLNGPRSLYAHAGMQPTEATSAGQTEVNLVQIRLGDGTLAGLQVGSGAYYLWTIDPGE